MEVRQLNDDRWIGCSILEVIALPLLEEAESVRDEHVQKHTTAFMQLVKEFSGLTGNTDNTMAEVLWLTEDAENQPFRSKIRLFLIIRHIGPSYQQTMSFLENCAAVFFSFLGARKYELRKVEGVSDIDTLLPQKCCTYAVIKREKCTANTYSPFPYYYCDVVPEDNRDNFDSLIALLSQQSGCYVSFQIFPSTLSQQEAYLIREMTSNLTRLSTGFVADRQMVQDPAAKEPCKVYSYYNERLQAPLFKFNILVCGNRDACAAISAKIISLLQSGRTKLIHSDFGCLDLAGEGLNISSSFLFYPWNINNRLLYAYRNQKLQRSFAVAKSLMRLPYMISAEEASAFFRLPLYERGMAALRGNNALRPMEQFDEAVAKADNIQFGSLSSGEYQELTIGCPLNTFTKHTLIVGVPGSGKTTFAFHILLQFYKRGVPFLAIEPTKAEYRGMIDAVPDLQIFTPGNSNVVPFILNPFLPPKGISIEQYIPSLASAFEAAFSMPSPLDVIFLRAIRECYIKYGWKEYSKLGDPDVRVFGLYEFILEFKRIIAESNYSREVKGNIESGGVFRLLNLIEQNRNIYDNVNSVPIEDLLSRPTVIELNAIDNSEQKSLIMALLLINICSYTKCNHIGDGNLKNVLLIDEAHVLLGSGQQAKENGVPDAKGATVKTIQDMIAEIRSYGTGIIIADQSPAKVSREVVAQTEIKVAFRLVQSLDKELIADTTNMDDEQTQQLSRLKTGEAYVYYGKLDSAQLLKTPDIREQSGIRLSVSNEEIHKCSKYWEQRQLMLRPYRVCAECDTCLKGCDFRTRADADFYAKQLSSACLPKIKDRTEFLRYAVSMNKLLSQLIPDNSSLDRRLILCVAVKFWRNVQLSISFTLSNADLVSVLRKLQNKDKERDMP